MLFVIQRLVARHPDLLAPPEQIDPHTADGSLRAAHRVLDALREVAEALDDYRYALHNEPTPIAGPHDSRRP